MINLISIFIFQVIKIDWLAQKYICIKVFCHFMLKIICKISSVSFILRFIWLLKWRFGWRTKLIIQFPIVQFFTYMFYVTYKLFWAFSHGIKMVFSLTDLKKKSTQSRGKMWMWVGRMLYALCSCLFFYIHIMNFPLYFS